MNRAEVLNVAGVQRCISKIMAESKKSLFDRLIEYRESDIYPFCMPGHKQRVSVCGIDNPYKADITEMVGFDDLHDPEGIIKDIMDEACEIYKYPHAFISVNGSTACNLAALSVVPEGGPVLIAANCHRSVFNGAKINRRSVIELAPEWIGEWGIYGGVSPRAVENAFRGYPGIKGFVLTSPTYEGFISDVPEIAKIVHSHGAILIVDEAHGAHLPFSDRFAHSALEAGRTWHACSGDRENPAAADLRRERHDRIAGETPDIVIQSLHKSLGSLNQTAMMFVSDDSLAKTANEELLMYTTTSPSYLLMASMQKAIRTAASDEGRQMTDHFMNKLCECYAGLKGLSGIRLLNDTLTGTHAIKEHDITKMVFACKGLTGEEFFFRMYDDYRLQLEKYGDHYVVAQTTFYDTDEGFDRLCAAMTDLDGRLAETGHGLRVRASGADRDHGASKKSWI